MAINPNTTFTSGSILLASQQNRFPFGVVAFQTVTATDATITAAEIQITTSAFTAIANRYYKITYFEPQIGNSSTGFTISQIRLTNLAGTLFQQGLISGVSLSNSLTTIAVTTLTAGSTVIIASLQSSAGTGSATRSATTPGFLMVEDIGPA